MSIFVGTFCNRVLMNFKQILIEIRMLKINRKVNIGYILLTYLRLSIFKNLNSKFLQKRF